MVKKYIQIGKVDTVNVCGVSSKFFENFCNILLIFSEKNFSPILWNKYDMIRAIPTSMLYTLIVHMDTSFA